MDGRTFTSRKRDIIVILKKYIYKCKIKTKRMYGCIQKSGCHDRGSNPNTSTCVCEFIMTFSFRLSTNNNKKDVWML